ncbi:hypothetical protein D5S17_29050 [Pseudonocardiaceae bacterium YIM PH 21723]|nr:hypothetical protein D5S17_29050 [Pseudonocardiaceae bacterium YIM PH 21723]
MRWISRGQQQRDHRGQRNKCAACGNDGTTARPLTISRDGMRIHLQHYHEPRSGYYGDTHQGVG